MIRRHIEYTGSDRGQHVIENWDRLAAKFIKVMPVEYKRALAAIEASRPSPANGSRSASGGQAIGCKRRAARNCSFPGSAWERAACEAPPRAQEAA